MSWETEASFLINLIFARQWMIFLLVYWPWLLILVVDSFVSLVSSSFLVFLGNLCMVCFLRSMAGIWMLYLCYCPSAMIHWTSLFKYLTWDCNGCRRTYLQRHQQMLWWCAGHSLWTTIEIFKLQMLFIFFSSALHWNPGQNSIRSQKKVTCKFNIRNCRKG